MKLKTSPEVPFFITGVLFMLLIAGIQLLVKTPIGLFGLLSSFLFGGLVGILAVTEKTSFLKDLVFFAAFAWILWAMLNPVQTVGDNLVIQSTSLLAIITFVVVFVERDIINSINRIRHKPAKFGVGFFGIILTYAFFFKTALGQMITEFMAVHWYISLGLILVWLVFLYFIISKNITRIANLLLTRIPNIGRGKR